MAVDPAGNYYIADANRIRKVSVGKMTTVAGSGTAGFSGDGGPATSALLIRPGGVALDSAGNLYIADSGNFRIRRVSQGQIGTIAGVGYSGLLKDGGPATSSFIFALNVVLDAADNIYISDGLLVRKISSGIVSMVAGSGIPGFSGDGGPARDASLTSAQDVAVDAAGNLYIADAGNNRIREVLSGNVTYQVAPAALRFSAAAGGSALGSRVISLSSSIAGLVYTASVSDSWLTVTASAGTIPTTFQVAADPSALTAGSYQGTITVTVPNASPAAASIPVTFTVHPATRRPTRRR